MKTQLERCEQESGVLIPQYQQLLKMNISLSAEFSRIETERNETFVVAETKLVSVKKEEYHFESIVSSSKRSQEEIWNKWVLNERFLLTRIRMLAGRIMFVRFGIPMIDFFQKKKASILIQFKEQHSAMFGDWRGAYIETKANIRSRSSNVRAIKKARAEEERVEQKVVTTSKSSAKHRQTKSAVAVE